MARTMRWGPRVRELRAFVRREHRMPSYREMMNLFGYRSKNGVHGMVRRLEALGYVRTGPGGRLAWTERLLGTIRLLGEVRAGFPSPAEEELVATLSLDEFLVRNPEATFLLTVTGDSMLEAGIHPGDIVLVEKGPAPRRGDIVIAQVDGEWTLKYFGRDREGVFLDPANAKFGRIRPRESLSVGGVVRAVVRKYT